MAKKRLLSGKTIVLNQFPTHIAISDNKYAPNKYMKITNQAIYNGAMNRFSRATAVRNLHDYVISCIPDGFGKIKEPVKPIYTFYVVRNHGNIRRSKTGSIIWKKPEKDYKATWDDDNLVFLWIKTLRDALTIAGVWEDDNVDFVRGGDWELIFVDDIKEMKITVNFMPLD